MSLGKMLFGAVPAFALFAGTAQAVQIVDLYNTGVAPGANLYSGGGALADDASDTHWTITGIGTNSGLNGGLPFAGVVATSAGGFPIGPWLGDSAVSAWTTPATNTNGPGDTTGAATYRYDTTFTTPGGASDVTLGGQFAVDNGIVGVKLDGVTIYSGSSIGGFGSFTPLSGTIPVTGVSHTLSILVQNGQNENPPAGPTGLRVEFSQATFTAVPEPASLGLMGLGTLGLLARRRANV